MRACVRMYMYIHTCIQTHKQKYKASNVRLWHVAASKIEVHMCMCVCVYRLQILLYISNIVKCIKYSYMYACMHVCMCECGCVCTHTDADIYSYIHIADV